jgi:energy-coupling factor transporter ATP-binding protein EcfA2
MANDVPGAEKRPLRVAVVGHCASGKSTLVTALRSLGFDASAVAQEHSGIAWLWRHSDPDVLIYLDVPLATVRDRRGQEWPQAVYDAQEERLAEARVHADLIIDTVTVNIREMTAHVLSFLRERAGSG